MRVIAGEAKGRALQVPRGLRVRPTASRLRESLFGMLEHRGAVDGARVQDLFAGAGGLGIEALSRGAASLVAVERDAAVARVLASNLQRCGFAERARILVQPAASAIRHLAHAERFDLVLVDPPYGGGEVEATLRALAAARVVAPGGTVVVETARGEAVAAPAGMAERAVRVQGDSQVTLLVVLDPDAAREAVTDARH
jgi:16S rRNA (guanine966-N2)-methyltransferase